MLPPMDAVALRMHTVKSTLQFIQLLACQCRLLIIFAKRLDQTVWQSDVIPENIC